MKNLIKGTNENMNKSLSTRRHGDIESKYEIRQNIAANGWTYELNNLAKDKNVDIHFE